jgi:hypothetical protein
MSRKLRSDAEGLSSSRRGAQFPYGSESRAPLRLSTEILRIYKRSSEELSERERSSEGLKVQRLELLCGMTELLCEPEAHQAVRTPGKRGPESRRCPLASLYRFSSSPGLSPAEPRRRNRDLSSSLQIPRGICTTEEGTRR